MCRGWLGEGLWISGRLTGRRCGRRSWECGDRGGGGEDADGEYWADVSLTLECSLRLVVNLPTCIYRNT